MKQRFLVRMIFSGHFIHSSNRIYTHMSIYGKSTYKKGNESTRKKEMLYYNNYHPNPITQ